MRPRTALALGLAGLATAGLGSGALPASADVRTFELTLADGRIITMTVDVPPGTDVWDIQFPDIPREQIAAIAEVPEDPPPAPQTSTTPTQPAPATTTPTAPQTSTAPKEARPEGEASEEGGEPQLAGEGRAGTEPKLGEGGGKQRTTGRARRRSAEAERRERERERRRRRAERDAEAPAPPAPDDPTLSIATPGAAPIGVPNFFIDKFRIPPFLLPIYQAAGTEYGVRWEILAAINEIETDYGRNLNVSSAGAVGWMQFLPSSWRRYGVDANGDGRKDPYNPVDAIFAAARYLRAAGAETDLRRAIFAYNHADWYVDSVLMRARLLGGLPSNLVGSLTGLTQGMFPVAWEARYADDLSAREARRRVAKGRNAAVPVESDAQRRGINVFARAGAPVVAVQDGTIVSIGRTERLGNYVKLRDAYGNVYTYARLKKIATHHPVPKPTERDRRARARAAAEPPRDPAPERPASAGRQPEDDGDRASRRGEAQPKPQVEVEKERLFADPSRPRSYRAGGREQLSAEVSEADLRLLDLPADQVEMRPLREGSRVVGGTMLGRIGTNPHGSAPHMLFEIRPAGRGAPRIDPKPILDGWKLLESTAIYRAAGRNPFFGPDARRPSIGQILLMSKADLERRVLQNPRIEVYGCGRRDIRGSRIDRRVLATLEYLAASGLRPTVTSLQCGHSYYTKSGNVSHHTSGNAVDIAKINGIPIAGNQGEGSIADMTVRRLLTLQGTLKPAQIISLMKYEGADNTFAMSDHHDHIHVGFTPYLGTDSKLGRQLGAILKPGQWLDLVDRLGRIDNPVVPLEPSKYAITVKQGRASRSHKGE